MPIYEYQCEACNHKFEVIQKVSDKPIKKCVLCQGKVQKILSAPGLLFKGSGWYVTDYAGKGAASEGSSSESAGGEKAGKESKEAGASKETKKAKKES